MKVARLIMGSASLLILSACMSRTEAPVIYHGAGDGITREIVRVLEKEPAFGNVIEKYKWIFPKSSPATPSQNKTVITETPKAEQKPAVTSPPPTAETIKAKQTQVIKDLNDLQNASPAGTFVKPVIGKIVSSFGPKADGQRNDGINIKAELGDDVKAAQNGEVIYANNDLAGFGNLVLIRHEKSFITAYAHLQKAKVIKGQIVHQGEVIGLVGSSGHVATPQLHFEIRSGAKPLDPQQFVKY